MKCKIANYIPHMTPLNPNYNRWKETYEIDLINLFKIFTNTFNDNYEHTLNFKYDVKGDDALMYTKKWMQAQRLARLHLFKAQEKQKFHYNLGTIETKFEVGDWVLLKTPPMAGKFINRWDGPFQITKSYSKVNYEIENV